MLFVVIQALKKPVMLLCTPFANRCLIYAATGLLKSPCIAHPQDGIHPVQIHLIGIRDSLDHRSVRNNECTAWGRDLVPFVRFRDTYLLLAEFSVRTVNYGPSFFPSIYGPSAKRAGHKSMEGFFLFGDRKQVQDAPFDSHLTGVKKESFY